MFSPALIPPALLDQRVAEHLGVLRRHRLAEPLDRPDHRRGAVGDRLRLGRVPLLHPLEPALLGGGEALALDRRAVHDHGTLGRQRLPQGAPEGADVVAVDHPHVGEVELLPPHAGGPERLERLLEVGTEALECGPDAGRQLGQAALHTLAGVPQLGVQADPVERAGHRADVGSDRHAVVVQQDDDRGAAAAGLLDGLEGHPAGHGAVSDHRHHVGVLAVAAAHRFLDPDRVADRGRGVAGPHDVVLGFVDGAERGQASVLADRREGVTSPGQHLVGIRLMADVPEDLVPRGVEHRVQRHGDLARAQVGSEVTPDLAHGLDDVLAHLLGRGLELVLAQSVEVLGLVDPLEKVGH
jgi:hypothetical protein